MYWIIFTALIAITSSMNSLWLGWDYQQNKRCKPVQTRFSENQFNSSYLLLDLQMNLNNFAALFNYIVLKGKEEYNYGTKKHI